MLQIVKRPIEEYCFGIQEAYNAADNTRITRFITIGPNVPVGLTIADLDELGNAAAKVMQSEFKEPRCSTTSLTFQYSTINCGRLRIFEKNAGKLSAQIGSRVSPNWCRRFFDY